MAPNYGSDLNSKNADHVRCLLWTEQKVFSHGRKPGSIIKDGKYKAKYCTTWEPESEDEPLCLCTPVSVRRLWREPLASFSSLDLTWEWLPLFSAWSLFFQRWMETETTDRKPGEPTLVAVNSVCLNRASWMVRIIPHEREIILTVRHTKQIHSSVNSFWGCKNWHVGFLLWPCLLL